MHISTTKTKILDRYHIVGAKRPPVGLFGEELFQVLQIRNTSAIVIIIIIIFNTNSPYILS